MKSIFSCMVLVTFLTACGGTCGNGPLSADAVFTEFSAQWVKNEPGPTNKVYRGFPVDDEDILTGGQAYDPAAVALVPAGLLDWSGYFAQQNQTPASFWSFRFGFFNQAHACSLSPPNIISDVVAINISVAASENFYLQPGADANELFSVISSQKFPDTAMSLDEWNLLGNSFRYVSMGREQSASSAAMLTFSDPDLLSGGSVAFALEIQLEDGTVFNTTTDVLLISEE